MYGAKDGFPIIVRSWRSKLANLPPPQIGYALVSRSTCLVSKLPPEIVSRIREYLEDDWLTELVFYHYRSPDEVVVPANLTPVWGWKLVERCMVCQNIFHRDHAATTFFKRCRRHRSICGLPHAPFEYARPEELGDLRTPVPPFVPAHERFTPHASLGDRTFDTSLFARDWFGSSSQLIEALAAARLGKRAAPVINMLEDLFLFLGVLQGCSNYSSAACAITAYAKTHFDGPIVALVSSYASSIRLSPQEGEEDAAGFQQTMEWFRTNWKLCVGSKFFAQVSKLLGILVMANFCHASAVTIKIKDISVIEPDLFECHKNAFSLVDAIMDTAIYFVENLYVCYRTRSIRPLLFGSTFSNDLSEDLKKVHIWWTYVKNGNLEKLAQVSQTDFHDHLNKTSLQFKNLLAHLKGMERAVVERKLQELAKIECDFVTMKLGGRMRKAPFVIEIFGKSNQGKSTVMDQILEALLTSVGIPNDITRRGIVNASEKYMSTWLSNMNVMILDDFANERPETCEGNPCRLLIDICNNCTFVAPKAEAEQKGKVYVEPDIVVITTNRLDLNASAFSNCPYSIQRRPNVILDVEARPEFQDYSGGIPLGLSPMKVGEYYTAKGIDPPPIEDLWIINRGKAVQPADLTFAAQYVTWTEGNQEVKGWSLPQLLPTLIRDFIAHREQQEKIVAKPSKSTMERCPEQGCPNIKGCCPLHPQPQDGEFVRALRNARDLVVEKCGNEVLKITTGLDFGAAALTMTAARYFCWHSRWLQLIPTPWIHSALFRKFYFVMNYRRMYKRWLIGNGCATALFAGAIVRGRQKSAPTWCFAAAGAAYGVTLAHMSKAVQMSMVEELHRKNEVGDLVKDWRDTHCGNLCKAAGIVGVFYALAKTYKALTTAHQAHGCEISVPAPPVEDVWAKVEKRSRSGPGDTTTLSVQPETLGGLVQKNLFFAEVRAGGKTYMANVLFLTSNLFVLPRHYMAHGLPARITMHGKDPGTCGGKFETVIDEKSIVEDFGTDLALCYSPTGGSFRDLRKHLDDELSGEVPCAGVYRRLAGDVLEFQGRAQRCVTSNNAAYNNKASFQGGNYTYLSINTFEGLCGAVLISQRKGSRILGIHVGGAAGTPEGCFLRISRADVDRAIEVLNSRPGIEITAQHGELPTHVLGKEVPLDLPLAQKSPIRYLPEGSSIQYHGTTLGRVKPTSRVQESVISACVERVCGVPNVWGSPTMNPHWYPFQTCLGMMAIPSRSWPPSLLERCVRDFRDPLTELAKLPEWQDRPLTEQENVNGRPGVRFIDAMVLSTSAGFPLSGVKRDYIENEEDVGNRRLTGEMRALIDASRSKLAQGERIFGFAKACAKDEVLKKTKKKCRIFYASAFSTIYLAREYYLPVLRFLQENNQLAECAVGSNCHGPDWEKLMTHVTSFGTERLIAGDYSKYDQTLPSQFLIAALSICCDIAKAMGYTDHHLTVMRNLIGDMVFPYINFNGDMISLVEGGWISGVPMTVHVNGICGSLFQRCAFFVLYPGASDFRAHVKLMTYGDDNVGSVKAGFEAHNIENVSRLLANYGMVYTMPDKESKLVPFLPLEEMEFLKRKSMFHEALGVHVGALDENSIFKSLHCLIVEKGDDRLPAERAGEVIDGALREWFNHGPEVYERRREEMSQIVTECNLHAHVRSLGLSYNARVNDWLQKYATDPRSHLGGANAVVEEMPRTLDDHEDLRE